MHKEPDTSNASDSSDPLPKPKLSLRSLGLNSGARTENDHQPEETAESASTPVGPTQNVETSESHPPQEPIEITSEKPRRPKLRLNSASAPTKASEVQSPKEKRKSTLSLAPKPPSQSTDPEPTTAEPELPEPLAPEENTSATTPLASASPRGKKMPSKARELARKRAEESARIADINAKPPPKETISDEAFDALLGAEPPAEKTEETTEETRPKLKVIEPVKSPSLNSVPPFNDSEDSVERLIISTFPRPRNTPPKRKSAIAPIAQQRSAAAQALSIDPAPPGFTMDTLRPSVSIKRPPPADAPLHEGAVLNPNKPKQKLARVIVGLVLVVALGGAGAYYFVNTEAGKSIIPSSASNPTPEAAVLPPEEPAAQEPLVSTPEAEPNPSNNPAKPAQPQRSPEITIFVENLSISMVRNRGADSILIIGGVAYRIGGIIEPLYELRFIGFTRDGKALVFEDGTGARYARAF